MAKNWLKYNKSKAEKQKKKFTPKFILATTEYQRADY